MVVQVALVIQHQVVHQDGNVLAVGDITGTLPVQQISGNTATTVAQEVLANQLLATHLNLLLALMEEAAAVGIAVQDHHVPAIWKACADNAEMQHVVIIVLLVLLPPLILILNAGQ